MRTRSVALVVLAVALAGPLEAFTVIDGSFTYQGRLYQAGVAQTGTFDLRFRLFPTDTAPTVLGQFFTPNVPVTGGLFKVKIDFGLAALFQGNWLEIGVAPGGSGGPYTVLAPRQELSPSPYALISAAASGLVDGVAVRELNGQRDTVTLVGANGLSVSAGGGTVTVTSNATPSNVPDTIVSRDFQGDFSAGSVTATTGTVGGRALYGSNSGASGFSDGVFGHTMSAQGRGTVGYATEQSGPNYGIWGQTDSTAGRGVYGLASATTGTNFGVYGETASPSGYAGYFQGPLRVNGPISTANSALETSVAGARALRMEFSAGFAYPTNIIGGSYLNNVTAGVDGGFVGGGGGDLSFGGNSVSDSYGTVGGGYSNRAGDGAGTTADRQGATVAGGVVNSATAAGSTVGGGFDNHAVALDSTVSGGIANQASGDYSTVAGGQNNVASGLYGTAVGGGQNQAGGSGSFAAGSRAKVRDSAAAGGGGDYGTFVWADWQPVDFVSTGPQQFLIRATGGVGINTNAPGGFTLAVNGGAAKPGGGSWSVFSDARLKHGIEPLRGTLDRLLGLRGVSFEYDDPEKIHELPGRRIGMIAQEVERIFPDWVGRGPDGHLHLTYRGFEALTVEAMRDLRNEKDAEIGRLTAQVAEQERKLAELSALVGRLGALLEAPSASRRPGGPSAPPSCASSAPRSGHDRP
jgi:hypothetical protein